MHFEVLKKGQEGLVRQWLSQDYVVKHWYGTGLKNTLKVLERFVKGEEPLYTLWIGYDGETPFAFLMTSPVDISEELYGKYCTKEERAITLDLLIGHPDYLGKGLAHLMIQRFLEEKFADRHAVFIDPCLENPKAIHVYQKAGFKGVEEFIPYYNPRPHLLMILK